MGGAGATTKNGIPPRVRVRPRRSVRGPRGVRDVPIGQFLRPGVLGGLSVSPWVVQEEAERIRRKASHRLALSNVCTVDTSRFRPRVAFNYHARSEQVESLRLFLHNATPRETCRTLSY